MTVDLSNLKVGDTVHIDCGGSIVVPEDFYKFPPKFVTIGEHSWNMNGTLYGGFKDSPFDIISITPKPEPKRIKGWVNVYDVNGRIGDMLYSSKVEADANAYPSRFACIYIDVAEGEGL